MLTSLVILKTHTQLFHAGTNATLTMIWQKFWIPTGRQCVESLLHHYFFTCIAHHYLACTLEWQMAGASDQVDEDVTEVTCSNRSADTGGGSESCAQ